jgi:phthiocerol/phenolphthiocerol synthesis type-I polyketide synthase C
MQHEEALQRQLWFGETLPLIEALTLSFIHEAFMAVAQPGQEALQAAMQGPVAASAYLRWMAELLIEEGLLDRCGWPLAVDSGRRTAAGRTDLADAVA